MGMGRLGKSGRRPALRLTEEAPWPTFRAFKTRRRSIRGSIASASSCSLEALRERRELGGGGPRRGRIQKLFLAISHGLKGLYQKSQNAIPAGSKGRALALRSTRERRRGETFLIQPLCFNLGDVPR